MREEIALLRQRLESQLQESVQEIVKSLSERIAERVLNAVAEQTVERTAAAVSEARENGQVNIGELDTKILSAAREALNAQGLVPRTSRKRSRKSPK
jgi:transcriptional regulator of acetoin/glycerol metabolism